MENPNLDTNDWDWEFIPNSDEHNHSTHSPSFGDRSGGVGVIRSHHFSLEEKELDNQGFTGIDHLGFSDHFAKSSEIVQNSGNSDVGTDSVTGVAVDCVKSSEIVQNSGNNDVEIINSVTGFSDHLVNSSEIVQNSGNNDVEISSFAKSSEIVQNSEVEINSLTDFSDNFAKSLGIVQNSGNNDVEIGSVTDISDHFSKSSEIVDQNSGNEEVKINSVTVLSDHSSKSSEIVNQNSGNDDAVSFSGECAEEQEQEQHGNCLNCEDDEERKMEGNENENENEKRVVWWKVPLEVLKYCALRVSPVWSVSMAAAALMGFVLLRRRYLYKMKRKSMSVQVNVTVHDKLTSQAARLNEAFSVVKRIPIIRPALPAPGMASWPVMSLR
ncbi:uncharacterized protein LOC141596398 isoform X2 [Silene latifolia]|uniref:uncharacterized protein LOC141596398 isoform X2 n=1 Tax=Silene latifolia TaxID=37657 RepID=UPI003D773DBE